VNTACPHGIVDGIEEYLLRHGVGDVNELIVSLKTDKCGSKHQAAKVRKSLGPPFMKGGHKESPFEKWAGGI
jgi:hypothetical protein